MPDKFTWSLLNGTGALRPRDPAHQADYDAGSPTFSERVRVQCEVVRTNGGTVTGYGIGSSELDVTDTGEPPDPAHPSVLVSLTAGRTSGVTPGDTVRITAAITAMNVSGNPSIQWSASAGQITGTGRNVTWTAPANVVASVTITCTVTYDLDGGDTVSGTGTLAISMVAADAPYVDVTVTAGQSSGVLPNSSVALTADITSRNVTGTPTITWTASAGSISGAGRSVVWNAPANVVASVTITCRVSYGADSASDSVAITMSSGTPSVTVSLSATQTEMIAPGAMVTINATVDAENVSGAPSYEWSPSAGTISGTGASAIWTAPSSVASNIRVTCKVSYGANSGSATISLGMAAATPSVSVRLVVSQPTGIAPGSSVQITAVVSTTNVSGTENIRWAATGGTIASGQGTKVLAWTAPSSPGTETITCTVSYGRTTGTATIGLTVGEPQPFVGVKVEAEGGRTSGIELGSTVIINAKITAENTEGVQRRQWSASAGEISGTGTRVTWTAPTDFVERATISCTATYDNASGVGSVDIALVPADYSGTLEIDDAHFIKSISIKTPRTIDFGLVTTRDRGTVSVKATRQAGWSPTLDLLVDGRKLGALLDSASVQAEGEAQDWTLSVTPVATVRINTRVIIGSSSFSLDYTITAKLTVSASGKDSKTLTATSTGTFMVTFGYEVVDDG